MKSSYVKCPVCNADVVIHTYQERGKMYVSHGTCCNCFKEVVLPNDEYHLFLEGLGHKVLECSSHGNKKFSAFHARVEVGGIEKSIEEHYQESKIIRDRNGKVSEISNWKDGKGKRNVIAVRVMGKIFGAEYLSAYYKLLWVKYLDKHPELVSIAKEYDEFTDKFRGKSTNCQADVIRTYIKEGRKTLLSDPYVRELLLFLKQNHCVTERIGDIFRSEGDIVVHQTNCLGIMGGGIAYSIRQLFPLVYDTYNLVCKKMGKELLGTALIVDNLGVVLNGTSTIVQKNDKIVANVFGQYDIGTDKKRTQEGAFKRGLMEVKEFAKKNYLSVSIPQGIGCNKGGGQWEDIHQIIKEVFSDYPVTIYTKK